MFDLSAQNKTDVLIIGGGLAGLLLALKLGQGSAACIVIVCKGNLSDSNSDKAQGGVALVSGANPFDSPEKHLADTLKAGAGLTDGQAAERIISGGARLLEELSLAGVAFDKKAGGSDGKSVSQSLGQDLDLALEGGHSQPRVVHSLDTTGHSIVEALSIKLMALVATGRDITILQNTTAVNLVTRDSRCYGAVFASNEGSGLESRFCIRATHTVLATGGVGQVFERTTNPAVATGDGIALAYRAGAALKNMEFVQFHPTALSLPGAPAFLISEAVRGAGAHLLDGKGQRFAFRYHQDGELATRDVVARAIQSVLNEHGLDSVGLDLRPIGTAGGDASTLSRRFPNIKAVCASYGVDIMSEPVPVAPAAHYMMGGIAASCQGLTSIQNLYAIGECACTGIHGANRLASNSLLEAGVMALLLGDYLCANNDSLELSKWADKLVLPLLAVPEHLPEFQTMMYRQAGLVRTAAGLKSIIDFADAAEIRPVKNLNEFTAANILTVGRLIAEAALQREESRGSHYRIDFPDSIKDKLSYNLAVG